MRAPLEGRLHCFEPFSAEVSLWRKLRGYLFFHAIQSVERPSAAVYIRASKLPDSENQHKKSGTMLHGCFFGAGRAVPEPSLSLIHI